MGTPTVFLLKLRETGGAKLKKNQITNRKTLTNRHCCRFLLWFCLLDIFFGFYVLVLEPEDFSLKTHTVSEYGLP